MTYLLLLADAGSPGYEGIVANFNTTFWSAMLRISQAMVAAGARAQASVVLISVSSFRRTSPGEPVRRARA